MSLADTNHHSGREQFGQSPVGGHLGKLHSRPYFTGSGRPRTTQESNYPFASDMPSVSGVSERNIFSGSLGINAALGYVNARRIPTLAARIACVGCQGLARPT